MDASKTPRVRSITTIFEQLSATAIFFVLENAQSLAVELEYGSSIAPITKKLLQERSTRGILKMRLPCCGPERGNPRIDEESNPNASRFGLLS